MNTHRREGNWFDPCLPQSLGRHLTLNCVVNGSSVWIYVNVTCTVKVLWVVHKLYKYRLFIVSAMGFNEFSSEDHVGPLALKRKEVSTEDHVLYRLTARVEMVQTNLLYRPGLGRGVLMTWPLERIITLASSTVPSDLWTCKYTPLW